MAICVLTLMITRHLCFKNLLRSTHQLCSSCRISSFESGKHAYQLFDKSPQSDITSVNHSIINYIRWNLQHEALGVFKNQLQLGLGSNVNEVTIAVGLKACRGDPRLGCQIHGFSVASGFVSYTSVSNSLMNMYCKAGLFEQALWVFESLSDLDIVSCNTVLSAFEHSCEALDFAVRMKREGIVFNSVTYTSALALCYDCEEFRFGFQLHSLVLRSGLDCEVFVGNALISMYSKWGHLVEAKRVFDEMPNRDLVSWNAMLSGYAQEGHYRLEAIWLFLEMVRAGLRLDNISFVSAITACGSEKRLELGRQIHGLTIKAGYEAHVTVCNVLISAYAKCGKAEDANLVFQRMSYRNVVTWTTMISVNEEDAMFLFNEMRLNDGFYPNHVTFVGLIHAISERNLAAQGQLIHGLCLKSGFFSQPNICHSLITMYAKFGSMQDSLKVFDELNYREITSWNALISGYNQNGYHREAVQAFWSSRMESHPNHFTFGSVLSAIGAAEDISLSHGLRCHSHSIKLGLNMNPIVSCALLDMYAKRGSISEAQKVFSESDQSDRFSWTSIISAHARHGDYESVMSLFKEMEAKLVRPDSITFLSVLTSCGRKGMVDIGMKLFNSMNKDYSIEPSPDHYSCVVDMLGRAGRLKEAEELMSRIPGGPGVTVLQSLLGSSKMYGDVEMGERAASALMGLEPMGAGCYVLMSNLYAEMGQWEKVVKIRKGMREMGIRKEVGLSWVDVGSDFGGSLCLHGFSSGDASHPQSEGIFRMAEFMGLEMKHLRESISNVSSGRALQGEG